MRKIFILLFFCANIFAQTTTGKVRGKVIDKTTGEPLPFVNVVLKGTFIGAATDMKGEYVILNVPVGTYTVVASMIGYSTVEVENVSVSAGLTTLVNFELEPTAIKAKEVVIKAKRPIIGERDVTSSVKRVSGREITRMPVRSYHEVITLQTGAVETKGSRSGGLHVRGGRSDEVMYVVDGINTTDPVYNVSGAIVDQYGISEMLVITGGFDAEYGRALSGVVNIVTPEGGSRYAGTIRYTTDQMFKAPPKMYHPVTVLFDSGNYYNYYNFGLNDLGFTLSGPIKGLKRTTFFAAGGMEKYNTYLPHNDKEEIRGNLKITSRPSNALKFILSGNAAYSTEHDYWHGFSRGVWLERTPKISRYNYQLNWQMYHTISAKTFYQINLGWFKTGRTQKGKDGLDYYDEEFRMIGMQLPWVSAALDSGWYNPEWDTWNFDWTPDKAWKWYYENVKKLGESDPTAPNGWRWYETADLEDIADAYNNRYYDLVTYYVISSKDTAISPSDELILTRITEDGDTLYLYKHKFNLEKYKNDIRAYIKSEGNPELFEKIEPSGDLYMVRYNDDEFNRFDYYFYPMWHKRSTDRFTGYVRLASQINRYNEITAGGDFEYDLLKFTDVRFINRNPYLDDYTERPILMDAYIQDKIEYEDMVMKLGYRFDYFHPREFFYVRIDSLGAGKAMVKPKIQFSPRFSIAYAVAERAKMFANYGHFFQPLKFHDLYQNLNADITTGWPIIGNPNLPPQKEIMYEAGVKYAFTTDMGIEVTSYIKDIKNLVTTRQIYTKFGKQIVSYGLYKLEDFAIVKGVSIELRRRSEKYLSGWVSYTWQQAKGTGSSPEESFYFYYYYGGAGEPPKTEYPLEFDITHTIKASINFYVPHERRFSYLGDLNINIQASLLSGAPYTPTDAKGRRMELGSKRMPGTSNIDVRIDKRIRLYNLNLSLFAIIKNLLNTKNVMNVYPFTGLPDRSGNPPAPDESYYESLLRTYSRRYGYRTAREIYEADLANWYRYYNTPYNYGEPRIIQIGLEFEF